MTRIKGTIIIFFLFLINNALIAQVVDLTGAIMIGKSELMSYSIVYSIDDKNNISGYSLSDLYGFSETKSTIVGTYSPKTKTLRFEEKSIVSTKSGIAPKDFCLMNVEGKFEKIAGKNVFKGAFVSHSANEKLICDSGRIALTTTDEIYSAVAKVNKALKKVTLPDSVNKRITQKMGALAGVEKVKTLAAESQTEYTLQNDTVQLDVLDDRLEDGDKITIVKNNITVIKEFEITNKVRTFKFPVAANEPMIVFTIIACNEGASPPNTVKMVITNGRQKELLMAALKKGQKVRILIKRK